MRPVGIAIVLGLLTLGCGRVVDGTKGALNKGGELAGSAATEVIEGVTSGVERSWGLSVEPSTEVLARGLVVGKVQVETNLAGTANTLVVYLSTDQGMMDTLQATAFDEEDREMGRSTFIVKLPAGGADFHTIRFQDRTDLERKSRIEIK